MTTKTLPAGRQHAWIAVGVLCARTRSLWLVVPLHGMVDLIPQLLPSSAPGPEPDAALACRTEAHDAHE